MMVGSLYFSLAIGTDLLLGTPHADALMMEVMFARETDTWLLGLELITTDRTTE